MELLDLNWVRLVLDGLWPWPALGFIALIFVGIPVAAGSLAAAVSSATGRSCRAGFIAGAILALIVIGLAYAAFD